MSDKQYPSDFAERFIVRLPKGLRDRLKSAAKANNRSMNAEAVAHLERGLNGPPIQGLTKADLQEAMEEAIRRAGKGKK